MQISQKSLQGTNTNTSDLSILLNPEFPFEQCGSEYLINKERYELTFDEESNFFSFSKPFSISSNAFVI